jgi:hypothetical protein
MDVSTEKYTGFRSQEDGPYLSGGFTWKNKFSEL